MQNLSDRYSLLLAIAICFPVYILIFFGMQPLTQGFAYLSYAAVFIYFWYCSRNLIFSKKFTFFWLVFLVAWIVPSIINAFSGRLESDLVNLHVLFVNTAYMTMLLFSYGMYFHITNSNTNFIKLLKYISFLIAPLALILLIKSLHSEYLYPHLRPSPFGGSPHFVAEILLVFIFGVVFIGSRWIKTVIFLITFFFLLILEVRAVIIPFIMITGFMVTTFIKRTYKRKSIYFLISFLLLLIFYYDAIFDFIDQNILYITSSTRGFDAGITWRNIPWQRAYESIQANPWLGTGFWVKPFGYELAHGIDFKSFYWAYNNPHLDIHSFWIRILTENGLTLFLLVVIAIGYCLLKLYKFKQWVMLIFMLSILLNLSFVTRHLTINILNAILYLIMLFIFNNKNNKNNINNINNIN